jgi:hypothetical protein
MARPTVDFCIPLELFEAKFKIPHCVYLATEFDARGGILSKVSFGFASYGLAFSSCILNMFGRTEISSNHHLLLALNHFSDLEIPFVRSLLCSSLVSNVLPPSFVFLNLQ